MTTAPPRSAPDRQLADRRASCPRWIAVDDARRPLAGLGAVFAILAAGDADQGFNIVGAIFFGTVLFDVLIFVISLLVEGRRKAKDRLVTSLVATAFVIALLPLISLVWTVVANGPRAVRHRRSSPSRCATSSARAAARCTRSSARC